MTDPPVTLLVIEDDDTLRATMADYLEDHGFRVLTAENGRVGVAVFERARPDLVMTDLRMPEMDGLEVLRYLHTHAPATPTIVISGTGRLHDSIEALHCGAWDYILKPIEDLGAVLHAAGHVLERARLLRENREYQELLEQRIAERTRELNEAVTRLHASEERFREMAELLPAAILELDADFRVTYANRNACTLFGCREEELFGHADGWRFLVPGERELARTCAMGSLTTAPATRVEYHALRRDGTEFPVLLYVAPRQRGTAADGCLIVVIDITAQEQAEARERALRLKLAVATRMESLGKLAGGVAHDLNNSLGPMVALPDLLEEQLRRVLPRNDETTEEILEALAAIKMSALRAARVVRDLLTLGRRGGRELAPLDLNQVLRTAMGGELCQRLAAELPGITFETGLSTEALSAMGSAEQLLRVVQNLVQNAAEAVGPHGRVTVTSARMDLAEAHEGYEMVPAGAYAVVTVRDTGCGMVPECREHIFEPFFTTKPQGERSGSGLGLAVVHGIVKDHGGFIDVESVRGQGTTFTLYFPRMGALLAHTTAESGALDPLPRGNERVLVVDDEPNHRFLVRRVLGQLGYRVEEAANGHEAVRLLQAEAAQQPPPDRHAPFALVIMDMIMERGFDGLDAYRAMAALRPDIRVLVASGHAENARAHLLRKEAVRWLAKPYELAVLARAVRDAIDGR